MYFFSRFTYSKFCSKKLNKYLESIKSGIIFAMKQYLACFHNPILNKSNSNAQAISILSTALLQFLLAVMLPSLAVGFALWSCAQDQPLISEEENLQTSQTKHFSLLRTPGEAIDIATRGYDEFYGGQTPLSRSGSVIPIKVITDDLEKVYKTAYQHQAWQEEGILLLPESVYREPGMRFIPIHWILCMPFIGQHSQHINIQRVIRVSWRCYGRPIHIVPIERSLFIWKMRGSAFWI